jgi:tripartite-type tricarboxylate transporter receptor subunit TctC
VKNITVLRHLARFAAIAVGVGCLLASQASMAQSSAVIKLIEPFPPGGGGSAIARALAPAMSSILGQHIIVDYIAGAGGQIGTAVAAKAAPDGNTILLLNTLPHTAAPGLNSKLPYDPVKDFTGLGAVASFPYVVTVRAQSDIHTLADLVTFARQHPGKLTYGSAGTGSPNFIACEIFKSMAGINLLQVPYRGDGPAVTALLGGEVDVEFANVSAVLALVKAGKLRALAVTSSTRSPVLADVPTIAELGYPSYEVVSQHGLVAPAGTPKPIVDRLGAAVASAVKSAEVVKVLTALGGVPVSSTPEEFDAMIRNTSLKTLAALKKAGIKPE